MGNDDITLIVLGVAAGSRSPLLPVRKRDQYLAEFREQFRDKHLRVELLGGDGLYAKRIFRFRRTKYQYQTLGLVVQQDGKGRLDPYPLQGGPKSDLNGDGNITEIVPYECLPSCDPEAITFYRRFRRGCTSSVNSVSLRTRGLHWRLAPGDGIARRSGGTRRSKWAARDGDRVKRWTNAFHDSGKKIRVLHDGSIQVADRKDKVALDSDIV
ncbi:hypothetical protein BU15DRAFT_68011 [Melanogaster broomeanus]|nr:hypothetical protein BU15DRAFT_68011 [Melanogaster broomeanus]